MLIHIYMDTDEFAEVIEPVAAELRAWVASAPFAELLDGSAEGEGHPDGRLGISTTFVKTQHLKDPLNALYKIAKTHKCEFAIARVDEQSGEAEDVCYFGFEEGRPDFFEVATYLSA